MAQQDQARDARTHQVSHTTQGLSAANMSIHTDLPGDWGLVLSSCAATDCGIGPLCTSAAPKASSTVTPAVRRLPAVLQEHLWRLEALT